MRLIDADALPITPVDITDLPKDGTALIVYSKENVDNAPTVEADVVRCKDCKFGEWQVSVNKIGETKTRVYCRTYDVFKDINGYGYCDEGEKRDEID